MGTAESNNKRYYCVLVGLKVLELLQLAQDTVENLNMIANEMANDDKKNDHDIEL